MNAQNNDGWAPLRVAAIHGRSDVVQTLLEKGMDVNAENNRGETALHVAARYGKSDVVRTLIDKGADVNAENNRGETALQHVLERYPEEERSDSMNRVMELLRNAGAR